MQHVEVVALRRPSDAESDDDDLPHPHKVRMEPMASAETDDRGQYRIFGLGRGEYYLRAEDSSEPHGGRVVPTDESYWLAWSLGSQFPAVYFPGAAQLSPAQVKLDGSSSVALDRIQVSLVPVEKDEQPGGFSEVKKDGSFEIRSVHDGSYSLNVWGLDNEGYIQSAQRGADDLLEKGLQIEGGSSGKIDGTGAPLEGSVSDADGAVVGARVGIIPDPLTSFNRFRIHATTTDQFGHFSLTDVAPGKYKVTAKPMLTSDSAAYTSEAQSVTLSENEPKTVAVKLAKQQE
jgi:Carboxypeptidase regulatory-like domain